MRKSHMVIFKMVKKDILSVVGCEWYFHNPNI
jgi:hypothetical protein